jgi:hypothetical protein
MEIQNSCDFENSAPARLPAKKERGHYVSRPEREVNIAQRAYAAVLQVASDLSVPFASPQISLGERAAGGDRWRK